jgi:hypothetical protein
MYMERVLGAAIRPAAGAASAGLRLERAARGAATRRLGEAARGAIGRAFEGPLVDVIAEDLVRYAVVERIMDRLQAEGAVERMMDEAVARLLESEALWVLVEEVAQSPAVTDAVTQQGYGFADQVAGGVRARSRNADAWLEGKARRALRRGPQ